MDVRDRIILALDVPSMGEAVSLVKELKDLVGAFKVGLELFTSVGPRIFESLRDAGAERIFCDAKFHDIPNTVAGAARAAVRLGVWMFNVHVSGGSHMMRAAVDAAGEEADRLGVERPLVVGVTVLTSINEKMLHDELRVPMVLENHVAGLALLAQGAGLDGVVASPHEIQPVKATCGPGFLLVTPGVRPAWADANDQKRFTTPGEAIKMGADYLVIGRAITAAEDRQAAAERILAEMTGETCQE